MLSLYEVDQICAATLAGAFGVHILHRDTFDQISFRRLSAGVANTSRSSAGLTATGSGNEQGKQ